ncbi:MAG: hypothetical protein AAB336_04565 [Acidobacteriota bacterium]
MKQLEILKLEVHGSIWENDRLRMENWEFELEERKNRKNKSEFHLSIQGEMGGSGATFSFDQIKQLHGWLSELLDGKA